MSSLKSFIIVFISVLFSVSTGITGQPLITDDTGTEGKNGIMFEFATQLGYCKEDNLSYRQAEVPLAITYGLADRLDVVMGIPYYKSWFTNNSIAQGLLDTFFEFKWQFFNQKKASFALKPGFTLPTGNNEHNFGTGKVTYSLVLVGTHSFGDLSLHYNLGYVRNANVYQERLNLWQISVASELELSQKFTAVMDMGFERNSTRHSTRPPGFLLAGLIYSLTDEILLDVGVKTCLNDEDIDRSVLTGISLSI